MSKVSPSPPAVLSRFQTYGVARPPIFQVSQSESLQSVTSLQAFNLEECFVTITNLI